MGGWLDGWLVGWIDSWRDHIALVKADDGGGYLFLLIKGREG